MSDSETNRAKHHDDTGETSHPGLLEKLMTAVRPEFRSDDLVFDPRDPVFGGPACRVRDCPRAARSLEMCHRHHRQWVRLDKPDRERFIASGAVDRSPAASAPARYESGVTLGRLRPAVKLEMQYAVQRRRDDELVRTRACTVQRVVNVIGDAAPGSLLDLSETEWSQRFPHPGSSAERLLRYARRQIEDLWQGTGWEVEYPRDLWRLRELGVEGHQARIRFDRIGQQWLKQLAKRWIRWKIASGGRSDTVFRAAAAITRFGQFLASPQVAAQRLAEVDRPLLERYPVDLHRDFAGSVRHRQHIGSLNAFFGAIRQHHWDDSLPNTALFLAEDYPKPGRDRLPRALAEHVMAQVEDPASLDLWDDPARRLITLILIRCGLRISDAVGLPHECMVADADGAPYLRYDNHKMNREALVPIDEELHHLIGAQQRRVLDDWPSRPPFLFPRLTTNLDGSRPYNAGTYRSALYRWVQRCGIRDEHGQPVHLTPHQWRHTLGTRLINRDVPQEVVRRILDHDSPLMTAHYARLHDTTVRRHWEAARKIDITGRAVVVDPDGPLAEAAWAKQRLGRATQALPNGFCGLPVQKTCPHANACLTCPMFITTAEFLPQHRQHRSQVLQIISAAEARSQTRLVEMNRQVADNLDRIITTLQDDSDTPQTAADAS